VGHEFLFLFLFILALACGLVLGGVSHPAEAIGQKASSLPDIQVSGTFGRGGCAD
jgi:hypothetical protein